MTQIPCLREMVGALHRYRQGLVLIARADKGFYQVPEFSHYIIRR
jgi:hypothetical protein